MHCSTSVRRAPGAIAGLVAAVVVAAAGTTVVPASPALAATVEYAVEDLGAFGGGDASYATGVNASGEVTGFADRSGTFSASAGAAER